MPGRSPVPFTVIGGFLGAGKTTLLNHVLRYTTERVAVLVNDFGTTPIDADLIATHDGDTISLANGCVCCTIAGELAMSLITLRDADPPFDRVIVEASGVSDPRQIAQYGTTPGFRLDGVIVLVDACNLDAVLGDERISDQVATQFERADLIVLTKADVATPEQVGATVAQLEQRCPDIPVVHGAHGAVPLPLLFDVESGRNESVGGDHPRGGDGHDFDSFTIETHVAVSRGRLLEIVESLPAGVLRAKGVVADESGARWVVHRVGATSKVTPGPATDPVGPEPVGRIVLIAPLGGLDGFAPPEPFELESPGS